MSTDIIEVPASELATVPRVETPSVETMLMHAIDRGVDPAALEKLVALHERVIAKRAESSFNQAMQDFKRDCPPLFHNCLVDERTKSGAALRYSYIDLPGLMATIDPVLQKHGLSYSFDCQVAQNVMTTTCTVKHVEGHSEKSSFTVAIDGTSVMSAAQKAGSSLTYGRRYSLQMALGICADADDDGRASSPPPENPPENPHAPTAPPRDKRAEAATKQDVDWLKVGWKKWRDKIGADAGKEAFGLWVEVVAQIPAMVATSAGNWTKSAVDLCWKDLESQGIKKSEVVS